MIKTFAAALAAAILAGCATTTPPQRTAQPHQAYPTYAPYSSGQYVVQPQPQVNMTGCVVGGAVGGLLGSQIGKGKGKVVAGATGAVIGTMIGCQQ